MPKRLRPLATPTEAEMQQVIGAFFSPELLLERIAQVPVMLNYLLDLWQPRIPAMDEDTALAWKNMREALNTLKEANSTQTSGQWEAAVSSRLPRINKALELIDAFQTAFTKLKNLSERDPESILSHYVVQLEPHLECLDRYKDKLEKFRAREKPAAGIQ